MRKPMRLRGFVRTEMVRSMVSRTLHPMVVRQMRATPYQKRILPGRTRMILGLGACAEPWNRVIFYQQLTCLYENPINANVDQRQNYCLHPLSKTYHEMNL